MRTIFVAVVLEILALAPLAQAEEITIRVRAPAEGASPERATALTYQRIVGQAETLCGPAMAEPVELAQARSHCRTEVIDSAIVSARSPTLAAYRQARLAAPAAPTTLAAR